MSQMIVVDASVVAGWFLPGETPDETALEAASENGIIVPNVWPLEIENILLISERRGRISAQLSSRIVHALQTEFEITVEERTTIFGSILSMARSHNLTSYGSSYLELCVRRKVNLHTNDRKLREAAIALGVLAT